MLTPEPFPEIVRRLAFEKRMTSSRVCTMATVASHGDVSNHTIASAINGRRHPNIEVMVAVAEALDVPPDTFPEYQLALARRELDEREVGLAAAMKALEARHNR